jgi:perosamine synthetase
VIRWWEPAVGAEEAELVAGVLRSNYLNEGDVTEEFERRLADLLGVRFAVATTSGTTALFLALAGLGVGHGDDVIVPDVTFAATANAVLLAGARPVLADVDPDTMNLDVHKLEQYLTPHTRAIIPVHVSGRAVDMVSLLWFARTRGLLVVEDATEALLSRYRDQWLGTYGDAGCFSFSPNKTITTGQGGLVVTKSEQLYRRLRELKDQGRSTRGTGGDDLHPAVGYNFKLTNLQAAVGLGQLTRLDQRRKRQREIRDSYAERLARIEEMSFFHVVDETPQWTDVLTSQRDELVDHLARRGIECRKFWLPLHAQAPYRQPDDLFPESTRVCSRALWLPSSFRMTDADVAIVCQEVEVFFSR